MASLGVDILGDLRTGKRSPGLRQIFVPAIVFPVFAVLGLYTLHLGLVGGGRNRAVALAAAKTDRADIVDRNGEILAKNTYSFDLVMNARQVSDPDKAAAFAHSMFPEISVSEVLEKIETGKGRIELKKNIGRDTADIIRMEKIKGISVVQKQVREYPKHNLASHIVGFVNKDGDGIEGMELIADEKLKSVKEPLALSVDARIQSIMRDHLNIAMKEYRAKAAMGILMNARTGEVLAAVNLPDFDPENISAYPIEARDFGLLRHNFEMGSIFKIFNTALALSHGIPLSKTFNVADPFYVSGRAISEARGFKPPAKNLNVEQIMQYSSNRGSAQMALSLPEAAQSEFFRELYFDRPIDTNFGRTARPLFPQSKTATDRSRWAFGHGVAVTPLHAFLAANAIANDGKYIMPTIYKRDFVPATRQIASKEVSEQLRVIMLKVMDVSGRAAAIQVHGINIGGKTSTAQKPIGGKYSDDKNITAFFAAFPIEAPKWSMLILLDEPESVPRTAAYNAVPVSGKIIDAVIPLL
ncbi:MAG: penicillin-binding protein 2 [Rickettsiales bacterium]|jgi:cell division protein FtsI (penicillin-binding protein 3)|nr:penicillin-binding protein 2 [Rickettsiales bacterium]